MLFRSRDVAKKGGILVGFRERNKSYVTPISSCDVLAPSAAQLLPGLTSLISEFSIRDRVPQVEVAVGDQDTALVFRNLKAFSDTDLNLLTTFAQSHGVQVFLQPQGPDSITPLWPREPQVLFYELPDFDLKICFSPTSFIQVNGAINEALVSTAINWLALDQGDTLLDLFCGLTPRLPANAEGPRPASAWTSSCRAQWGLLPAASPSTPRCGSPAPLGATPCSARREHPSPPRACGRPAPGSQRLLLRRHWRQAPAPRQGAAASRARPPLWRQIGRAHV